MPWARIDDAFDDHPKVLAVLEHDQGGAAIGLWTLCLTWAYRNTLRKGKTPGRIPASLPRRYLGPGARELAALLVKEHLWEPISEDEGWQIHDFEKYLATPSTREARSEAGKRGAAARWGSRKREAAGSDGNLPGPDDTLPSGDGKAMAADGRTMADPAATALRAPEPAGSAPGDSKKPSSDGKLPSGHGKPMASDGSRAPARRAIPNGIASRDPLPGIPPTAAQDSKPDTAQTLVAEWLDHCRKRPPDRVVGQVAKELGILVAEGQDPADIRRGLAAWHQAAKHPSTLASFVNEVMNGSSTTRKAGTNPLPGVSPRDEHRYRR